MSDNIKNRRRNYFIKRQFQAEFMIKFCILLIIGAIVTGTILYLLSINSATTAFINSRLSIIRTADYLLPNLISASLISIVLISIATIMVVMYWSHRIAGPLFNIERSVNQIAEGDFSLNITLRATDEISKLADSLNTMVKQNRSKLNEIKTQSDALQKEIDKLSGSKKETLKSKKEVLDRTINGFKLR